MKINVQLLPLLLFSNTLSSCVHASSRLAYRRVSNNKTHRLEEQKEAEFFSVLNEEDRFLYSFSYSMSYPSDSSSRSQSADTPNSPSIFNTDPAILVSSLSPTPAISTITPTFTKFKVRATPLPTLNPSYFPSSTPTFNNDVVEEKIDIDNDNTLSSFMRSCHNQSNGGDTGNSASKIIELAFRYTAEVTSENDDSFLTAVESKLLDTVSSAVLKCDSTNSTNNRRGRMLFHPIFHRQLQQLVSQVGSMPTDQIVGSCTPISSESKACNIVEAKMTITTTSDQEVDVEQVKAEALEAISNDFSSGEYIGVSLDGVNPVDVVYLGPFSEEDSVISEEYDNKTTVRISSSQHSSTQDGTTNGETGSKSTMYAFVSLTPLAAAVIGTTMYNRRKQRNKMLSEEKYLEDVESHEKPAGLVYVDLSD